jgi:hypothetical protein
LRYRVADPNGVEGTFGGRAGGERAHVFCNLPALLLGQAAAAALGLGSAVDAADGGGRGDVDAERVAGRRGEGTVFAGPRFFRGLHHAVEHPAQDRQDHGDQRHDAHDRLLDELALGAARVERLGDALGLLDALLVFERGHHHLHQQVGGLLTVVRAVAL